MTHLHIQCFRIPEEKIPKNGGVPAPLAKWLKENANCGIHSISEHFVLNKNTMRGYESGGTGEFVFFVKYSLPS